MVVVVDLRMSLVELEARLGDYLEYYQTKPLVETLGYLCHTPSGFWSKRSLTLSNTQTIPHAVIEVLHSVFELDPMTYSNL